jgi:hypothetical protein
MGASPGVRTSRNEDGAFVARDGLAAFRCGSWPVGSDATNLVSVGKSASDVLALCLSYGGLREMMLLQKSIWRTSLAKKR